MYGDSNKHVTCFLIEIKLHSHSKVSIILTLEILGGPFQLVFKQHSTQLSGVSSNLYCRLVLTIIY